MTSSWHHDGDLPKVYGRYLLLQRLSRGGMGEVFLAKHGLSGFEKVCVIKKVLPHLNQDEHFISRFVDEAQVAIQLQHANIAQVFEVGRVVDEYFLAIEFVEGHDLRCILDHLAESQTRLPVDLALWIARNIASGLAYAHRRTGPDGESLELVHCDVSPPNVVVSFEGEVKIIDFGIARSAMRATATDPKIGFGKFGYMAPEQLLRGAVVDHRTDIYATGSILFEMLTGRKLYVQEEGADFRTLAKQVIRGKHPAPSEIDPELAPYDALVASALHPKADKRFQTAGELRDTIQHALVQINPTISSDAMAGFVREQFAGELDEWRSLADRVREADLDRWAEHFADQRPATVSFALAQDAELARELSGRVRMPYSSVVNASGASRAAPRKPRWNGRVAAIALIALFMLAAGSAFAVFFGNSERGRQDDPVAPTLAAEVPRPAPPPGPSGPTTDDGNPDDHAGESVADEPHRRRARRGKKSRVANRAKSDHAKPERAKTPSRSAIESKFSEVNREYRGFKQNYGARLDKEWNDLVQKIQFDKEHPDKLRDVDWALDRFRKRMKEIGRSG